MIKGIDNIRAWFVSNKICYWKLRDASGIPIGMSEQENENQDQPTALNQFEALYDILSAGRYNIEGWTSLKDNKNRLKVYIIIPETQTPPVAIGAIQPTGLSEEEVDRRVKEALAIKQREDEIKEMKAKLKELESNTGWFDRLMTNPMAQKAVLGGINYLSNFAQAPQPAIAGVKKQEVDMNEQTQAQVNIVEKSLEQWVDCEPQFAELVTKLSEMAKANDPMYQTAKSILLPK